MEGPFVESLGYDANIQSRADATSGFGMSRWLEAEKMLDAEPQNAPFKKPGPDAQVCLLSAAHSFVIAASLYACFDSSSARRAYWAAARCYQQVGSAAAAAFIPLTDDYRFAVNMAQAENVVSPDDITAVLIQDSWSAVASARLRADVPQWRIRAVMGTRVGSASIPFQLYRELYSAIVDSSAREELAGYIVRPATTLLQSYGQAIEIARADTYHWQRAQSLMLPAPPEILAFMMCVVGATSGTDVERRIIQNLKNEVSVVPLQIARSFKGALAAPHSPVMKAIAERQSRSTDAP